MVYGGGRNKKGQLTQRQKDTLARHKKHHGPGILREELSDHEAADCEPPS